MIRLVCKATLLAALGVMIAGAVMAGVPNAAQSNLNGSILQLGGSAAGVVDVRCEKQILVRDAALNPVANSVVIINFATCALSEIRLSTTQPHPGLTVNCAARTVSATTNASGIAVFRVLGGSNVLASADAGAADGCASVTADGVPLGNLSVATADMNAANVGGAGVTGTDTVLFTGNRFGGPALYRPRANFAGVVGSIDGVDTVQFTGYRFGGGSSANGATFCP